MYAFHYLFTYPSIDQFTFFEKTALIIIPNYCAIVETIPN